MSIPTRGHSYFWALGAILGAMAIMLPDRLMPGAPPDTKFLMVNGGLFVIGAFLGTLDPISAWRWGIATVLLLPGLEFSRLPADKLASSMSDLVPRMLAEIPLYAVQAIPALIGAYLGSFFSKGIAKF
jgi:hypothetical protein